MDLLSTRSPAGKVKSEKTFSNHMLAARGCIRIADIHTGQLLGQEISSRWTFVQNQNLSHADHF